MKRSPVCDDSFKQKCILLAFITSSPETKVNQIQTSCEIVPQYLLVLSAFKNNYRQLFKAFRAF